MIHKFKILLDHGFQEYCQKYNNQKESKAWTLKNFDQSLIDGIVKYSSQHNFTNGGLVFFVRPGLIGQIISAIGIITPLSITAPAYILCSVNSSSQPKALITFMLRNCRTPCGLVESSL